MAQSQRHFGRIPGQILIFAVEKTADATNEGLNEVTIVTFS